MGGKSEDGVKLSVKLQVGGSPRAFPCLEITHVSNKLAACVATSSLLLLLLYLAFVRENLPLMSLMPDNE